MHFSAAVVGPVALGETSPTAEEGVQKGVQPAFQTPPPPPPWSKYFSCHFGVSCVLFVLPATEKFGMPSVQIVIVYKEKSSRN
jgi:hypothetical protein